MRQSKSPPRRTPESAHGVNCLAPRAGECTGSELVDHGLVAGVEKVLRKKLQTERLERLGERLHRHRGDATVFQPARAALWQDGALKSHLACLGKPLLKLG